MPRKFNSGGGYIVVLSFCLFVGMLVSYLIGDSPRFVKGQTNSNSDVIDSSVSETAQQPPEPAPQVRRSELNFDFTLTPQASSGQDVAVTSRGIAVPASAARASFTSPSIKSPLDAPEPFLAISAVWSAEMLDGSRITISLRGSTDDGSWSDWQDFVVDGDSTTEEYRYVSGLLLLDQKTRFIQYRVALEKGEQSLSPILSKLHLIFISPGATPQTMQQRIQQGDRATMLSPTAYPKPPVATRTSWGCPDGAASPRWTPQYTSVTHLIVHHTVNANTSSDWPAIVRSIWNQHTFTNGWGDIGYNYLVDPNGNIYEGRAGGDNVIGAHFSCVNSGTMGVAMIGTFTSVTPTAPAMTNLKGILAWKADQRGIDPTGLAMHGGTQTQLNNISGHRDANSKPNSCNVTECPGNSLYPLLPTIRNDVKALLTTGQPNLTSYQPSGWSAPIIVSTVTGTNTDSSVLRSTDTLYVDWAVINNGAGPTAARFYTKIFVDGVEKNNWYTDPPLNVNSYAYIQDFSIGSLSAGQHIIKIITDITGAITESNELDNEYTKFVTVSSSTYTLTITSSNPSSGVTITLSPSDNNGLSGGTTQFTRTYNNNAQVSLTAPSTAGGNNFQKWQRDGTDYSSNQTVTVTMDANRTMTAVYVTPPPTLRTLTVASSNPGSGVNISLSPSDNNGQSGGTTQFARTYNNNAQVSLTAPSTAGGNNFQKWLRDDADFPGNQTASVTVTMDANHKMTVVYSPPQCYTLSVTANPSVGGNVSRSQAPNCNLGSLSLVEVERGTQQEQSAAFSEYGSPSQLSRSQFTENSFRDLIAKARLKGSVNVIIGLRVGFKPEGLLANQAAIKSQRDSINRSQEELLNRIARFSVTAVTSIKRFDYIPYLAMQVDATGMEFLERDEEVISIEEDVPVWPALAESTALIGATNAWAKGFSGAGQTIAILDTGVDKTHPFLANKVVSEACYSSNTPSTTSLCPGAALASTNSGAGVNCALNGCNHGTHVAGIAAGRGTNFSGVARDANIIAIQVFSRGDTQNACGGSQPPCITSFTSDLIRGLERVLTLSSNFNVAAVNMSLGDSQRNVSTCDAFVPAMKTAIDNLRSRGVATVIASGNDSFTNGINFPACISTAISVGSTGDGSGGTVQDRVANDSNSASFLHLLAPGTVINSSIPGGGFANFSGTSMAAPHVAGAWAVLKSKYPTASVDRILSALTSTGLSVTDTRNNLTKPRLQLNSALDSVVDASGYLSGTVVTLTATPNQEYRFVSWAGCDSSSGAICTVTMNNAKNVTANFERIVSMYQVSVAKAGNGSGTVTSNTGAINCGGICQATLSSGTQITLTATPASGSTFAGWNGDCSGTGPCSLTMDSSKTVIATFNSTSCVNPISVSVPANLTGSPGTSVTIPVNIGDVTGRGVTAYQFVLNFDSNVVVPQVSPFDVIGTLSSSFNILPNTSTSGRISIAAFGTSPLSGSGTLLNLKFTLAGAPATNSDLAFASFTFNEGMPCATTSNGRISIVADGKISGAVGYAVSSQPKIVPGVTLNAAGATPRNATTDNSGNYQLVGLGSGAYTVTPTKTGGINSGISAFDASMVAQCVAGIITCTSAQIMAGDASNNGSLSAFDASMIAQYVAGIANSNSIAGTWKFTPPNRSYSSVNGNLTGENYGAVLVGDVSGNWTPSASSSLLSEETQAEAKAESLSATVRVTIPTMTLIPNADLTIPIAVDELTGMGVTAYDFDLLYDPHILRLQTPAVITDGALSRELTVMVNTTESGRLRVSAFGINSLTGGGTLLKLNFQVIGMPNGSPVLSWQRFQFNEGLPQVSLSNYTRKAVHVSAASFRDAGLSSESLAVVFGSNLATATEAAGTLPLPLTLAGATVRVRDSAGIERPASLLFVSPSQINYQIPSGTAVGVATINITANSGVTSSELVRIEPYSPGLFTADANGQGVAAAVLLRVRADGSQSYEPVAHYNEAQNKFVATPIDLGVEADQVYLLLFGTGLRHIPPTTVTKCQIGGEEVPVLYVGQQGDYAGLDQINLHLPRSLKGRGEVELWFTVDGKTTNLVKVSIK